MLSFPLWLPTLLLLTHPLVWYRHHRRERRRQRAGLCRLCGYDLRAHAPGQLCPECGSPVPTDIERKEIA